LARCEHLRGRQSLEGALEGVWGSLVIG